MLVKKSFMLVMWLAVIFCFLSGLLLIIKSMAMYIVIGEKITLAHLMGVLDIIIVIGLIIWRISMRR